MALAMKNSFKSFDRLKESGIPAKQARSIVEVLEESADSNFRDLVTKSDLTVALGELRIELKKDIAELRTELKGDIAELRTELKGDIAELRTELKGDIAGIQDNIAVLKEDNTSLKGKIIKIKADVSWLKRMFFGVIALIIGNIVITLLHL